MKALELLQIIYRDCKEWEDKGFAVAYPTSDLNQAINELEDLQNRSCKSETCDGCINYKTDIDGKYCLLYYNDFDFICSRGYWIEDKYSKEIK